MTDCITTENVTICSCSWNLFHLSQWQREGGWVKMKEEGRQEGEKGGGRERGRWGRKTDTDRETLPNMLFLFYQIMQQYRGLKFYLSSMASSTCEEKYL